MRKVLQGCIVMLSFAMLACPPKRPPAVRTTTSSAESTAASETDARASTDELGTEIQPLGDEYANATDLEGDWTETGPLADIHFEYDQYSLTDLARSILEGHSGWIQAHPGVRLLIEGHCDERGTVEYNLALGDRRARAAQEFLVQRGVDPARVTTVSLGKERPLDLGHDEDAWARNRRVHFAIQR